MDEKTDYPPYDELKTALQNLVTKLDEVIPEIENMTVMAHIHGQEYKGPHFGVELAAAKKVLNIGE